MKFHLDDNELATCVSCGLCLPHCPTFRATGEEALSPRGRIAAIRAVHHDDAPVTPEFVSFMESCVQCRGCEPACPSGVHYGNLQEGVRETLAQRHRITPRWQRAAFAVLPRHRLLLAGSSALAVAQRMHLVPRRAGLTTLAVRRPQPLRATGTDVWLFTGCVMDAWMRDTHRSTAKVLDHLGVTFALPGKGGGCCGALHTHAGLTDAARHLAANVMSSMPGDAPIVVNSAGCGAALKEYGHLLGTPAADLVELDDDGLCCGAGGAYSVMEPALAGQIRERKLASIARAGGGLVASANPGCAMHLAAAGLTVRHPIDILAEAL